MGPTLVDPLPQSNGPTEVVALPSDVQELIKVP